MDLQTIARLEDYTTLTTLIAGPAMQVTQEASGNIWTPTIIFSNSPLSDQTIVDRQVEISNLARQTILDLKAVLTVVKKSGAIPAPPEEAVEVLNRNSFSHSFSFDFILKG